MKKFLEKFKNLILGKKESEEIIDNLRLFNKTTASYLKLLDQEVKEKDKQVKRIRVLVTQMKPRSDMKSQLNIQLVDINNTKVSEKGKGSFNQKMDWEKKLREFSNKKGKIV
ncbi:hypothetical protein CL658_01580 [bacterium]|nr:hypothetical protein [bacterium]|tara:strand:- start:1202 stop:1537 length:336 start_codon:yes stop_codon:yes gene_type:complete